MSNLCPEPQGIGGFVYQEIKWTDQTYNIMKENCYDNKLNYIKGLYYDSTENKLFCYQEECVDNGFCKDIKFYFPITVVNENQ